MSSRPLAVLLGSPGAGTPTVGGATAERLGVDLLDTDAEIERRAGKTVSDIFVEDGEEAFRALEREVVAEALASHPGVVALGGRAILNEQTRADLAGHRVVYLEVEFADAAKRVGLDTARPLSSATRAPASKPAPRTAAHLPEPRHAHRLHERAHP